MYVLRAHLKHLSAMTRYSAAVFMKTRPRPHTVICSPLLYSLLGSQYVQEGRPRRPHIGA
jgi:hypothetical protein